MYFRVLLAWLLMLCSFVTLAAPPAEWQFKTWPEAMAQAKQEKKPLFVLFGFENCPYCRVLYRGGMNDSVVMTKYQESLALAYVDTLSYAKDAPFVLPNGSQITHQQLLKLYKAYPTPSWVFLSESGEVLLSGSGGRTTSREFLRDLENILRKPER
jgi:thioredoxin-related protein